VGLNPTGQQVRLFGRPVYLASDRDLPALVGRISESPCQRALFCNVHMLMLSQEDGELARAMEEAEWVFADGAPIAWLQRRVSARKALRIQGYELLLAICGRAASNREKIGLLGSTPLVLNQLTARLQTRFPGLSIPYRYAPPFAEEAPSLSSRELDRIRNAELTWLFVGLGCPKQEKWVARHSSMLDCHVLAVGAAFDWLAGTKRKPPAWMEHAGLGWLHRFLKNPREMWHRYLIYNTKFITKSVNLLTWRRLSKQVWDEPGR